MNQNDNRSDFTKKLDDLRQQHEATLQTDLAGLKEQLGRTVKPALPEDIARRLADFDSRVASRLQDQAPVVKTSKPQALIDIAGSDFLKELDRSFADLFRLGQFFPQNRLDYPTVYCETLGEFFSPFLADLDYSPQVRQSELERLAKEAEEDAKAGGGIFGVNFPSRGCYLNGWLFAYGQNFSPHQALQDAKTFHRILEVAAHEKLGHGFLSVYSAMGAVKTHLGLASVELADRFGLRPVDEPTWRLRQEQAALLFMASQLLEEGFASWVAPFMARQLWNGPSIARHSLKAVVEAIQALPKNLADREKIQQILLSALQVLFGEEPAPLGTLHQAVMIIETAGASLDEFFGQALGQPLRYAIGDLLFLQAEANQGPLCLPYSALIAANLTFDPAQISLSDLRELMSHDPRLNPDVRLAALSRTPLARKNDVHCLAEAAETQLSLSVPKELK